MHPGQSSPGLAPDFESVHREFQPRIRRYLDRLVGADDADDLTQEVFTRISQALPRFRGDSSLSTWVYRIATNAAYDRLRSPSFHRSCDVPLNAEAAVADRAPAVDQTLVRREMNDCIGGYVARLPASYRSVLTLSEREGFTNPEIAATLGITVETVKIRLHRARARLRNDLKTGCRFYHDDRNELSCEPKPSSHRSR